MKPEQVKELVAKWRPKDWHEYVTDGASRDPGCRICGGNYEDGVHNIERVKCADELEQAEREAVGQPEGEDWWSGAALDVMRHAKASNPPDWDNAIRSGLLSAYNRGQDAPRPEASTRETALEKLRELEARWRKPTESNMTKRLCADELRAVLAEFEKEGK